MFRKCSKNLYLALRKIGSDFLNAVLLGIEGTKIPGHFIIINCLK